MKKYTEGYVLPLVMVVLVILSAFSLSVLSPAVSNLSAQKASIERTTDRYNVISLAHRSVSDCLSEIENLGLIQQDGTWVSKEFFFEKNSNETELEMKSAVIRLRDDYIPADFIALNLPVTTTADDSFTLPNTGSICFQYSYSDSPFQVSGDHYTTDVHLSLTMDITIDIIETSRTKTDGEGAVVTVDGFLCTYSVSISTCTPSYSILPKEASIR